MKKTIAFIASLALAASITGCGSVESSGNTSSKVPVTSNIVTGTNEIVQTNTQVSSQNVGQTGVQNNNQSGSQNVSAVSSESNDTYESSENTPNAYGFYSFNNPPASSISVASLAGKWYLADDIFENVLTITATDDLYYGEWAYAYEGGGSRFGYILLEYDLNPDNTRNYWFTFYETNGDLWEAFAATGEIPLNDIYAGQQGSPHFVRASSVGGNEDVFFAGDAYLGRYGYDRITLDVEEGSAVGGKYVIQVSWPNSAYEYYYYTYRCTYDEEERAFVSSSGDLLIETYTEGSSEPETEVTYGESAVFFTDSGTIRWDNRAGDNGDGIVFVKY